MSLLSLTSRMAAVVQCGAGSLGNQRHVNRKKFDDNQWWELFDSNTSRFYYYNATTQKTVWHKPQNCDIIPLAKLQQIKQNTEVSEGIDAISDSKESIGTQTPAKSPVNQQNPSTSSSACLGSSQMRNGVLSAGRPLQHSRIPSSGGNRAVGGFSRVQQRPGVGDLRRETAPNLRDPWSLQGSDEKPRGLHRSMTSSMTQTSPSPSPRLNRRASHHHHHHHHGGSANNTSSSSGSHHHRHGVSCPHRHHQNANGENQIGRRVRRSSQSSQSSSVSYSKANIRESGRLSDSSMSQSRTSLEGSAKMLDSSFCSRESQRGRARSSGSRADKIGISSPSHLVSPSTPSCHRRTSHDHAPMSKQQSFDVSNFNPKRSEYMSERPREIVLSRSYSFMSKPKCYEEEGIHEKLFPSGMRSVESTPQPRRRHKGFDAMASSPESSLASQGILSHRQKSDSSGLESLATPMTHRKQRSLETGRSKQVEMRPSVSAHTRLVASDSSGSPPSPRHDLAAYIFESPRCPDSGASTLTDKETRSQYGRGSADSSPHSQIDSGLVSGTTGSRGSADSSIKRSVNSREGTFDKESQFSLLSGNIGAERETRKCGHHRRYHCNKHRPSVSTTTTAPPPTTDSDRSDTLQSSNSSLQMVQSSNNSQNHNSSSASSTTAKQSSPKNRSCKQESSNDSTSTSSKTQNTYNSEVENQSTANVQHRDMTHLYSNLDYVYDQPVYQFIMEQAKLSGYRIADPLYDDADSLHSDDSGGGRDDSDEFADDEGMSNADSSSQEYLDDVNYLADDETYTQFFMPLNLKTKCLTESTRKEYPSIESNVADTSPRQPPSPLSHVPTHNTCNDYNSVSSGSISRAVTATQQSSSSITQADLTIGSLRRKKDPAPQPPHFSPIQEKPSATSGFSMMKKPFSETDFERLSINSGECPTGSNLMEKYAQENLNVHTRGILRKKVPVIDMISWTKEPIRKPMLATLDKTLKSQACEMFKLVQIYMSDRKPKPDMTLNSVGLDIVTLAFNNSGMRDELYVQICRQTTENRKGDSLRRGWELMAICLEFFPPSEKFIPYLAGYITKHCDPAYHTMYPEISKWPIHIQINHYAGVCSKRLERTSVNAKRQRLKKPTLEEIDLARLHIFRASMFGGTLEEIMALQRERYPHRRLPWVQTTLSEEVLRLQGTSTEGIFRVPADFDEPLIPDSLYASAIEASENPSKAVSLVNQLPEINRLVLAYLIRFLQYFSQPDIVLNTKMDANNLAMVMAPNCLRCTSDDPKVIYENTRKEMAFIRTLIQHLDTTFIEGLV
ncbi:Rho GTPase-activating protein 39 [Armadillidium nasatum]|uniref:Rho GTPase-activating protein 39 n=1 Tax=Armadillidium nasatum TaxID=96803 RepID=A0A5N5TNX8_9CRUS|nr:Rho GTPase-activating protein 39 [Armadillidium nasatum]